MTLRFRRLRERVPQHGWRTGWYVSVYDGPSLIGGVKAFIGKRQLRAGLTFYDTHLHRLYDDILEYFA